MTYEEVKKICDSMWQADLLNADIQKVREALEKQTPKKPMVSKIVIFSITNGERKEEIVSHYYHCPVCGRIVYEYDCCADNNCRQKIDWSDAE